MVKTIKVSTKERTSLVDITGEVERVIRDSGVKDGLCVLFVPHTTAGITINENADPSVKADMLKELNKIVPFEDGYSHMEGNAAAHIKSTLVGQTVNVFIEDGAPVLGTWQGVFFCEFDGPRQRKVLIKIT